MKLVPSGLEIAQKWQKMPLNQNYMGPNFVKLRHYEKATKLKKSPTCKTAVFTQ